MPNSSPAARRRTRPPRPHLWVAALLLLAGQLGCSAGDGETAGPGTVSKSSDFDLSRYAGKVVVLNFWATWCGPCRVEIPSLVKLRREFGPDQVAIIGISLDAGGTPEQMRGQLESFIAKYGINYPIFHDPEQKLAIEYNRKASFMPYVPATLLFDQKGEVRGKHLGVPRNEQGQLDPFGILGDAIQSLLDQT